jgi:glycerol-3-phosphate acyltransferase PlsX
LLAIAQFRTSLESQSGVSRKVTIALDAMGGDRAGGRACALATLERRLRAHARRLGRRSSAESRRRSLRPRLQFGLATEVVSMDEPLADALRRKKDSSLRGAIEFVKSGEADVRRSGNTGALMYTAITC